MVKPNVTGNENIKLFFAKMFV